MATSLAPILTQILDNYGEVAGGGSVETYEAGTTTPLVTYTDLAGAIPNANPVVLDSAGRATIRVTDGVGYKFIVKNSDGETLITIDNIVVGTAETDSENQYLVSVTYAGTPGAQGWLGGCEVSHAFVFPINFDGSVGSVGTAPAAEFIITAKKNGVECGTISFATTGVPTFATSGGATVSCAFSDRLDFYGPDSVGTAADILLTLVGDLA
jgi:hypothetical protein